MQGLELYRVEDYELRIRGALDGLLDISDPLLTMAFVGRDQKPLRIEDQLKVFAWRIKPNTFADGYAPPISKSACLTPSFIVNAKGLIHTNQAEQIYTQLQNLGVGPYMIEAEGRELGTGLSLRGTLEIALY